MIFLLINILLYWMNIIPLKIWLSSEAIVNDNGAVTVTDTSFNSNEILVYKVDYLIVLQCLLMWCSTKCSFKPSFFVQLFLTSLCSACQLLCASWLERKQIRKTSRNILSNSSFIRESILPAIVWDWILYQDY